MTLEIKQQDGFCFLSGTIDENADLSSLSFASGELKLNLRYVQSMNSVGTVRFIKLVQDCAFMNTEFHECQQNFISMINMIPALLGPKNDVSVVKSVFSTFVCPSCDHEQVSLVLFKDLSVGSSEISVPSVACESCQSLSKFQADAEGLFSFLLPNE